MILKLRYWKVKKIAITFILLAMLILPCNAIRAKASSVSSVFMSEQVNPYQTRSELLMSATNYVGIFTPEQAATVWATGLINRSAAMQYVVMTESLKEIYARQLGDSNWVTGESSPWISSYEITKSEYPNDTHAEVGIVFEALSAGVPYKDYNAKLWLVKENDFWRIEKIQTDKDLNIFTGFDPAM